MTPEEVSARPHAPNISWLVAALFQAALWVHSYTLLPVVEAWELVISQVEESCKAFVCEAFNFANRLINGVSAWVLLFFDSEDHRERLRSAWRTEKESHEWWIDNPSNQSSLNAVVANCGPAGDPALRHGKPSPLQLPGGGGGQ